MRVHQHIGLSLVASGVVYAVSRSVTMTAVSFAAGVLIDLDHVLDYVREYGFRPDIKYFFHVFYNTRFKRIVLPFHSWELLALIAVLAVVSHYNAIVMGIGIGVGHHMIADQWYNKFCRWGYFFSYRLWHAFVCSKILPGQGLL